jgi:hypothetical protein
MKAVVLFRTLFLVWTFLNQSPPGTESTRKQLGVLLKSLPAF